MNDFLQPALAAGTLRDVDLWLARHLLALADNGGNSTGDDAKQVALAVAATSRASADGDVCIDLSALAGTRLFASDDGNWRGITAPPLADWETALRSSGLVSAPGAQRLPLVLDSRHRLYLHRYWAHERTVADALRSRLAFSAEASGDRASALDEHLRAALPHWFGGRAAGDRQQMGAAIAVLRQLAVISGGPGTGKTTTVARILALLVELGGERPPVIRLAAPTGKAAARLTQSIRAAKAGLRAAGNAAIIDRIPEDASTLHRLLGVRGGRRGFEHHAGNPLALDVLVVDEASMVDLALMASLLAALPAAARLILLGDRDQLASVEAGSVLGDICNRGAPVAWSPTLTRRLQDLGLAPEAADNAQGDGPAMADSLVVLTESHRFRHDSGIGRIARAINEGRVDAALAAGDDSVQCLAATAEQLPALVDAEVAAYWLDYAGAGDARIASARFDRFRFLCALRDGPFGVARINALVEQSLQRRGLPGPHADTPHYAGRPILVTRNDYGVGLFNGDVGLVLPDVEGDGALRAFFVQPDDSVRRVALNRLPAHETAFAMTVHKSQGSEFDRVVVVLPDHDNRVLTRELVYTDLTRARSSAALWASPGVLAAAVRAQVRRASGLHDALWSR